MRKVVAFVQDEPEIANILSEVDIAGQRYAERKRFISQQLETIKNEMANFRDSLWERIEAHLKTKGSLPPDYSHERYGLHYDSDLGVVIIRDAETIKNESNPLASLFRGMSGQE